MRLCCVVLLGCLLFVGLFHAVDGAAPVCGYKIINQYNHDSAAFTQGLYWDASNNYLYEGTGLNGQSSLRKVDLQTGHVEQRFDLNETYFGEGIALFSDFIYQLTWQNYVVFKYDKNTFKLLQTFKNPNQGWGLTTNGTVLFMTDGSSSIHIVDPTNFKFVSEITVKDGTKSVRMLNELEWIDGMIWANIWMSDKIVVIDPATGLVQQTINLSGLKPSSDTDVLNGIAYDATTKRIFVTGKLWPKLYQIEVDCPKPVVVNTPPPPSTSTFDVTITATLLVVILATIAIAYFTYHWYRNKHRNSKESYLMRYFQ